MASTIKRKINEGLTQVKNTASFIVTDVTSHWSKPGKGNYVPYKEILNYSIGGMGQNMLIYLLGYMALGVTNTLFASTIGIRPMHLQNMLTVQTILNIVFQIIRGKIVDNTNTRWGRFRPYLAIMGAPLAILSIVFIFLPFESMAYSQKYMCVFIFAIAISIGQPLYQTAYTNLGSVISPSTAERSKILAISSLIYSFAPTIYQLFVPIFSNLTGGFTDIRTYKYIVVPIGVIGVFLSFFAFFGCKERIVSSKHFVKKVSIIGGCVAVWKNKYWWLRTISTWFNFLEGAYLVLFGWIYIYGTQDMTTYGILQTVLSIASGLSMFATPFFLKWLGNKGILLFHNILNIVFIACMLACYEIPLLYFLFLWINTFINQLQLVYNPVLNAEVKDSIQWQSGKRVDYMLEVAALIGTPVTILSGYFLPFIYESYGLTVNYDVLYDPNVRNSLFYMLCALSILGAALNLAPYFLYNLSREKHSMVVLALKYRAANTDYRTGDITPHQVKDLVESYNYMVERRDAVQPDTNEKKAEMKAAKQVFKTAKAEYESLYESIEKATPKGQAVVKTEELLALEEVYHQKKQAYKDAKFAYKDACKLRRDKEAIEEFIDTELGKWDTPKSQVRLALAKAITSIDKNDVADTAPDLSSVELPDLAEWTVQQAEAKQRRTANRRFFSKDKDVSEYMPWAEKKAERTLRSLRSLIKRTELRYRLMQKLSKLFFKNGLEYDYEEAYKKELDVQCFTKEEKKAQNKRIRSAQFKYNRFASAYKLYIESETLLLDFGDRNNFFDYILPMYDECVIEAERIDREEEEKAKAEKEAKNAEIAEIKLEKRMRKDAKKEAKANGAKFDEAYFEQFKRDHADDYVTPATAEDVSSDADPGEVADAADSADNGAETAAKEDNDNEN
ncbi:MAG TPA: MFS transporter [Candidatus Ornithoclostridium excrementipullorum]|nr:MFS transporter [Candidatus Ornithoclostridium excrementipullorum]